MAELFDEPTSTTTNDVDGDSTSTSTPDLPRRRVRRAASRPAGAPVASQPVPAVQPTEVAKITAPQIIADAVAPTEDVAVAAPVREKRAPRRATRATEAPSVVSEPVSTVSTSGGGASVVSEATVRASKRNTAQKNKHADSATNANVAASATLVAAADAVTSPQLANSEVEAAATGPTKTEAKSSTTTAERTPRQRRERRTSTRDSAVAVTENSADTDRDQATERSNDRVTDNAVEAPALELDVFKEFGATRGSRETANASEGEAGDPNTAVNAPQDFASSRPARATRSRRRTSRDSEPAFTAELTSGSTSQENSTETPVAQASDEVAIRVQPQRHLAEDIFNLFSAAPAESSVEDASSKSEELDSLGDSLFQEARPVRVRRRAVSAAGAPGTKTDAGDAESAAEADKVAGENTRDSSRGTTRTRSSRNLRRGGRETTPALEEDETDEETLADTDVETMDTDDEDSNSRRRRRRGGRGRRGRLRSDDESGSEDGAESESESESAGSDVDDAEIESSTRRRRRRRRSSTEDSVELNPDDPPNTVVRVRASRNNEVRALRGSTRLEAKKQRRRETRDASRRKQVITEAEFLARRESVERAMVIRERSGRTQVAVLEDGVLVEHYVARKTQSSTVGNVYLGKVQNVLPSMEAAFVDIGRGRNAVLYAGEVNWDAVGLEGQPRRIEVALKPGDSVLVQVTKDPVGHKGARLTSQISLPGRFIVLVPGGNMTGISRKLPDVERSRLKKILKAVMPEDMGVIVRTAAEGASEDELVRDVERLTGQWAEIQAANKKRNSPASLSSEPDLAIKVVRDVFNEDFTSMTIQGDGAYDSIYEYLESVAPELATRITKYDQHEDIFADYRIDEQLQKAMDRNVFLPSGGSLVIDRTEAMTVVDVNTGKFTGSGGTLEETVTKNNLEAAEEIVRQLRLRDIGGIIVVDFIDMVLESNRDLVLRRLVECLSRDRTRHQVAEVTSLGLIQMTRKRMGEGLLEVFSETCTHCNGRGLVMHDEPVESNHQTNEIAGYAGVNGRSDRHNGGRNNDRNSERGSSRSGRVRNSRGRNTDQSSSDDAGSRQDSAGESVAVLSDEVRTKAKATIASIAAAAAHASEHEHEAQVAESSATASAPTAADEE